MNTLIGLLVALGGPAFYTFRKVSTTRGFFGRVMDGAVQGFLGGVDQSATVAVLETCAFVLSGLLLFWLTQRIFAKIYLARVERLREKNVRTKDIDKTIQGYAVSDSLKYELHVAARGIR